MKNLSSLTILFACSLINSGCGIIPTPKEIVESIQTPKEIPELTQIQELKKIENYTVLVESKMSSQGLTVAIIPTVSIVTENGHKGVLVVGENYEPVFQNVELGKSEGSITEVLTGIKEGERIFIDIPPWLGWSNINR